MTKDETFTKSAQSCQADTALLFFDTTIKTSVFIKVFEWFNSF